MTAFRVGMKVCCIDDVPEKGCAWADGEAVEVGKVYTIKSIRVRPRFGASVRLVEIERSDYSKKFYEDPDLGYLARRFRPIVSRPTSIAVFQAMLTGKKVGEPVNG